MKDFMIFKKKWIALFACLIPLVALAADTKLSDLPAVTTPASTDEFIVNQGGVSKKETRAQLHTLESGEVIVLDAGSAAAPAIGWTDTGFHEQIANQLFLSLAGSNKWEWAVDSFRSINATGGGLQNQATSATNPTVLPRRNDLDSGVGGGAAADQLSLIAGGVEAQRFTEVASHIIIDYEIHAGLTAGTTQTQAGGLVLLSSYNEISTVANAGDSVVLPAAAAGREMEIINHGANLIWIWPASGDDLGAGVDAKFVLEANDSVELIGIDASEWHVTATTEVFHGSMYDEFNTDAFVVSDPGGDETSYHTNGLQAGQELGWTFDAGGAGTSFPIASIADGADSGVDIAVTTTGSHLLAIGDVISQSNLADSAYVGIFVVKAIISGTIYEVAAVFTATGTGTMDQAATLTVDAIAVGEYFLEWSASMTSATNNETFDFRFYKGATAIPGTSARRKFGTAADFGVLSGLAPPFNVVVGDKISIVLANQDTAGNLTIRNLTILLNRI